MKTHQGYLLLNRIWNESPRFYWTLRDLKDRSRHKGDYAVKALLVVEDEKPVWEAKERSLAVRTS